MQVTKTALSATKVKIKVEASAADLEPIRRHVLGHFVAQTKVPGFRSGKAPLRMVEKHANQQALADEFLRHALNDLYSKVLDEQNIRPLSEPEISLKKFVPYTELEFEAELETLGEVALPDYKKIKLSPPTVTVTADEVKKVIESLRKRSAERKEVNRIAETGDEVVIDFSGKDKSDKPISGAEGKDYPLILGEDTFIPGFEDNLIGTKTGETKKFELDFPADYGVSALAGKNAKFSVDVKKIHELILPKLDDSFAAKSGPFKTLTELKADIKKQLVADKQQQARQNYENGLVSQIANQSEIEIPVSLVDEQIIAMENDEKRNLAYRGQTWQEHLELEGVTEQQHRDRNRQTAEQRVKGGLVLSEIARQEGLQVTPEELEARLQALREQYKDPAMLQELSKPETRREISSRILTEKTVAKLVEYASK